MAKYGKVYKNLLLKHVGGLLIDEGSGMRTIIVEPTDGETMLKSDGVT